MRERRPVQCQSDGLDISLIAERMGRSVNSIKARLKREKAEDRASC